MSAWVGILLLIVVNALYVAAEFGAVGVRRSRVRRMAADGHPLARRLLPYVESPQALDRYVGASQIGITLSSLMLGAYAQVTVTVPLAALVTQWWGLEAGSALSTAAIIVLIALTAAQLVIGELVPKALALQYPTQCALATVVPMMLSLAVFRPFLSVLNGTATLVLRLIGIRTQGHRHLHSPEEIALLIVESRDGGLLEPEEQKRLHRALQLGLRRARDLMVPLDRLTALRVDAPWDEVVQTVTSSPFSRLPIYRGTRERIIGILRVRDLVSQFVLQGPGALEKLMRPVVHAQADLPADRVIAELRARRAHQAVVIDQNGGTIGLITIQDLLAELLGPKAAAAGTSQA